MKERLLAGLPGWQSGLRELNRPEAQESAWHGALYALVLGLGLGMTVSTLWWSAEVDQIVARKVAAATRTEVLR